MTRIHYSCCLSLLLFLQACAFHPSPPLALQPVGPAPVSTAAAPTGGTLLVYSALERFGDPRYVTPHSSYSVSTDDGKPVEQVPNHTDRFDEGPDPVLLAPGSYVVTAESAHFGRVALPVNIKAHQTTTVYLDGYPHPGAPSGRDAVKLPDGEIVGWSVNGGATLATQPNGYPTKQTNP